MGSVGFSRSHNFETPQGGSADSPRPDSAACSWSSIGFLLAVDVLSAIQHNSLIFFVGGLF